MLEQNTHRYIVA